MITILCWYFIVNLTIVLIQVISGKYDKSVTCIDMIYMVFMATPYYIGILVIHLPISILIYFTIIKRNRMVEEYNNSKIKSDSIVDTEDELKRQYFIELHLGFFFTKYPTLSGNWYYDKEQYERIIRSK